MSQFYPNPDGYAAQLKAILAWEAYGRLPPDHHPNLVVHGEHDRLVPPDHADLIALGILAHSFSAGPRSVTYSPPTNLPWRTRPSRTLSLRTLSL